jgi:hypothetical protein
VVIVAYFWGDLGIVNFADLGRKKDKFNGKRLFYGRKN